MDRRLSDQRLTIAPEFVRNNEVYAAVEGGELIAFYALTGTGRKLELEDPWVSPAWIGSGVGRLLFEHAIRPLHEEQVP